jgi:hypothetical protein
LELLLSGRGVGATLPVRRWRADHLMAVLAPIEKCSAAPRADEPSATASTTRSRKSRE